MNNEAPHFVDGPNGRVAFRKREGDGPRVVWFGGYRSDMLGTKAQALDEWAERNRRAYLRFDYTGHGESEGRFEDGTIGKWAADAEAVLDAAARGPRIFIGSSMGAWVATMMARRRPDDLVGAIFIAPAPDFTERLLWPALSEAHRAEIAKTGKLELPSDYADEPDVYTRALFEDGRENLVMSGPIAIDCPVRIFQGQRDDAVPWRHALDFAEKITSDDVEIVLTKAGDHRLSSPADIDRLIGAVEALSRR